MPGFRLLLQAEVSDCTPWSFAETPSSFAEKEAWVQNNLWIWSFVGREPVVKSVGWEPEVKVGSSSRLPNAMVVPVLGSHCGR
jgi:hypothetical protein